MHQLLSVILDVLMFPVGKPRVWGHRWGKFQGVPNRSMVPWWAMVVPYCYHCAPGAQPAILTIANAYTARMPGGMQRVQ